MSSAPLILLCVQFFLVQNAVTQCFGGFNPAYNRNFGYGGALSRQAFDSYNFGRPLVNNAFGSYGCTGGYGGAGIGNVAMAADMPVGGNTVIGAQVPIIGAVQFGGEALASGAVCISATCGCGCSPLLI